MDNQTYAEGRLALLSRAETDPLVQGLGRKKAVRFVAQCVRKGQGVEGLPYSVSEKLGHGRVTHSGTIVRAVPCGFRWRAKSVLAQWQLTIRMDNGSTHLCTVEKLPRKAAFDSDLKGLFA